MIFTIICVVKAKGPDMLENWSRQLALLLRMETTEAINTTMKHELEKGI